MSLSTSSSACVACPYCQLPLESSSSLAQHLWEAHPANNQKNQNNQNNPQAPYMGAAQQQEWRGGCQCPECVAQTNMWDANQQAVPDTAYSAGPMVPPSYPFAYYQPPPWMWAPPSVPPPPAATTANTPQLNNWKPYNYPTFMAPFVMPPAAPAGRYPDTTVAQEPSTSIDDLQGAATDVPHAAQGVLKTDGDAPSGLWCTWCRHAFDDPQEYVVHMRSEHPPVVLPIPVRRAFPVAPSVAVPTPPSQLQSTPSSHGVPEECIQKLSEAPFRWGDFTTSPGAFPLADLQPDAASLQQLHGEVTRIQGACDKTLRLFGSLVQNLGSSKSDLDLCFHLGKQEEARQALRRVEVKLRKAGGFQFEAVLKTRVPVLRSLPTAKHAFDISVASEGLHNSWLVREYVLANPDLVFPLVATVVQALKRCELHGNRSGCLSTFAIVLMVLHFLLWRRRIAFIRPASTLRKFDEYEAFPEYVPVAPPAEPTRVTALLVDFLRFHSDSDDAEGLPPTAETRVFPASRMAVVLADCPFAARSAQSLATGRPLVVRDPVQPELDTARNLTPANWKLTQAVFRWLATQAESNGKAKDA